MSLDDPAIDAEPVTLEDMLAAAKREAALRRSVYPGLIARGKLKADQAQRELRRMEQIAKLLEWMLPRQAALRKMREDDYREATRGK